MDFFIFVKRYCKTPLFFLVVVSALVMSFFYHKTDLSLKDNLKVAVIKDQSQEAQLLVNELMQKESFFQYIEYTCLECMERDIEKGKISYGFVVDFEKEVPFTLYGEDGKFSEIAKEDFYSSYFSIVAEKYTKKLLHLKEDEYRQLYEKEKSRTFAFAYGDKNIGKVLPIKELSAFFLYVFSLLVGYEYFLLTDRSRFFDTMEGRKKKEIFIATEILLNAGVFFIPLYVYVKGNILLYILYTLALFVHTLVAITIFSKKVYINFMPLAILMACISIFMRKMGIFRRVSLIFLNNWYVSGYSEIIKEDLLFIGVASVVLLLLYGAGKKIKR